jgi:small multidrug resistance pump
MTPFSLALLASSTMIFVGAASSAKAWALSANSVAWLALTLVLYTAGNLIMLRLIRDVGMSVALSLSAVVQLVAVNVVALAFFGERVSNGPGGGDRARNRCSCDDHAKSDTRMI